MTKTTKIHFVGGPKTPNRRITNDGGRPPSWKNRKRPYLHNALTDLHKIWHDQATCFILACCYGIKDSTDMSHTRLLVWGKEEWEWSFVFPKLACCSTNEGSFHWKCEESQFSEFYGEMLAVLSFHLSTQKTLDGKKIINKSLCPTALPENTKPAPDFILEIIRCSYKSQSLCSTKRCSNVAYLAQSFVLASVVTELW